MNKALGVMVVLAGCLALATVARAQDVEAEETVQEQTEEIVDQTRERVGEFAADVDQSETAEKASAGILKPIYLLAEQMSFPAFHWVAFTLMTAGVIGFALQLVFAKLVVLSKMGFSLKEILSDALGLAISLFGLVLTTQAAAENSSFTQSPFAVLSATVAGVLLGLLHWRWGQAAEVQALAGRKQEKVVAKAEKKS
jgi:hypothetical protein